MFVGELRTRMSNDLRAAMKERNKPTISLLRTLMAALDNAEAVAVDPSTLPKIATSERYEVPRKMLTQAEVRQLLEQELADRQRAYMNYVALGLANEAEQLQMEINLIASYI